MKCKRIHLSEEDRERFLSLVDTSAGPDACWPWRGRIGPDGYGEFYARGPKDSYAAHRIALFIARGKNTRGRLVCHHCDNPPCCNPAHLFRGTHLDNNRDMIAKGRSRFDGARLHPESVKRGEEAGNAKLCEADVRAIRAGAEFDEAGRCMNASDLGKRFGIRRETVHRILKRRTWAHLNDAS